MNDSLVFLLGDFKFVPDNEGNIDVLHEKINSLVNRGIVEVNAESIDKKNNITISRKINLHSFLKIKEMQALPDAVVLDFLISKGGLKKSDFVKRIIL